MLIARVLGRAAVARAFSAVTIRSGIYKTKGGTLTFYGFKRTYGKAKKGMDWHHIVEQGAWRTSWSRRAIHNPNNLVMIPRTVHQKCINKWMARKNVNKFGVDTRGENRTMRKKVRTLSFERQHRIGVEVLRHCGIRIPG